MTDQAVPGQGAAPAQGRRSGAGAGLTAPMLVLIFMATLILPVSFDAAGIRLTPLRLFLLVMFIPLTARLLSGEVGRIRAPEIFLALFCFWMVLTIVYHNGAGRLPFAVISVIEILAGYMIGRCLIRGPEDFKYLIRLHLLVLVFLLPFSVMDFVTGNELYSRLLNMIGDAEFRPGSSRPRWGFERVMNGFDHPILYGLFCSMAAANVVYIWRDQIMRALTRLGFVIFMTFMSLSAGAVISTQIQVALMIWHWLTKGQWRLLLGLFVFTCVFLEIVSNRGPVVIFIDALAFSPGTAWTRITQWEWVGRDVMQNPLFGAGLERSWQGPSWLHTRSIDSLWLVVAFRHGLVGVMFQVAAFASVIWIIVRVRKSDLPEEYDRLRTGYIITLVGVCFTLVTVHVWDALATYVYVYLGAGMWILTGVGKTAETAADPAGPTPASPYTRFAPAPPRATPAPTAQSRGPSGRDDGKGRNGFAPMIRTAKRVPGDPRER